VAIGRITGLVQRDGHQQRPEVVAVSQVEVASAQPPEEAPPHRLDYILLILEDPDPRVEMAAGQRKEAGKVALPNPPRRLITEARVLRPEISD
jgi:hypothetical protein